MGRPLERFCKRGHDTWEVGRIRKGWCRACAYYADAIGGIRPKPQERSPGWERERVRRWQEIAAADPMIPTNNTKLRVQEFEQRYQRLEAAVPTPENDGDRLRKLI